MGIAEQKSQVAAIAVYKDVKMRSYQLNHIATLPNHQENYKPKKISTALHRSPNVELLTVITTNFSRISASFELKGPNIRQQALQVRKKPTK